MKALSSVHLDDVVSVYGGAEGALWELVMGRQIHVGGFKSSMALAECAGIAAGTRGVDLCCCRRWGPKWRSCRSWRTRERSRRAALSPSARTNRKSVPYVECLLLSGNHPG